MLISDRANDRILGRCDAERLAWEFELYHYPPHNPDRPSPRDQPVKKDDHALDALRYLVMAWEQCRLGAVGPPKFEIPEPIKRSDWIGWGTDPDNEEIW